MITIFFSSGRLRGCFGWHIIELLVFGIMWAILQVLAKIRAIVKSGSLLCSGDISGGQREGGTNAFSCVVQHCVLVRPTRRWACCNLIFFLLSLIVIEIFLALG